MEKTALKHDGDKDYELLAKSVWIKVGGLSLYIKQSDEEVTVDVFANGNVAGKALRSWSINAKGPWIGMGWVGQRVV